MSSTRLRSGQHPQRVHGNAPAGDKAGGLWSAGIAAAVSGAAFFGFSWTRADPDLWGHVRFGQLMLETGAITRTDPYSYLAEQWINHEWLAEVVFGALFNHLGTPGLVTFKVLIGMLMFGMAYWLLTRGSLDALRAGIGALLVTWLLYVGMRPIRPQLFTYVLFMAVLLILKRHEETGRHGTLLLLPSVFVLWTNLHGGFLAGLGVLFIWTAAATLEALIRERRLGGALPTTWPLLAASVASAAATLVNPYGPALLGFLLRTATAPRPEITEWMPVEIASVEGVAYLFFLLLVAIIAIRTRRTMSLSSLAVLAVTVLLPLLAIRHLPLFGIAGAVLAGGRAGAVFRRASDPPPSSRAPRRRIGFVAGGAGLVFAMLAVPNFGCIQVGAPATEPYPTAALELLKRADGPTNLAVFFNWGQYVIWHLGPQVQVSMDGRRETVYNDSIYQEYYNFLLGTRDWDALLVRRATDAALVPRSYPVYNLLELKPGWELAFEDEVSALFLPAGSALAPAADRPLSQVDPAPSGNHCFP